MSKLNKEQLYIAKTLTKWLMRSHGYDTQHAKGIVVTYLNTYSLSLLRRSLVSVKDPMQLEKFLKENLIHETKNRAMSPQKNPGRNEPRP